MEIGAAQLWSAVPGSGSLLGSPPTNTTERERDERGRENGKLTDLFTFPRLLGMLEFMLSWVFN